MLGKSIQEIREEEFTRRKESHSEFKNEINLKFKCLHYTLDTMTVAYIVLCLFEYILYSNFIASNKVFSKCDIEDRIKRGKSKYAPKSCKTIIFCI